MKNCNQGSYQTRYRHAAAMARFIRWVVPTFGLQKIANIQDKHLICYGKYLIGENKAHKYIKDELAGIRFVHRHTPNFRYELGDSQQINQQIGLSSTPGGLADRKWTHEEFRSMVKKANETGNERIALMMEFSINFGARLDEVVSLKRHDIEYALRNKILRLSNTKGGRVRYVPVKEADIPFLQLCIQNVPRGTYVFCPEHYDLHSFKKYVQQFIRQNREDIQDINRTKTAHGVADNERGALSFHGLRHSFCANEYQLLLRELEQDRAARKELAERLGHSRTSITRTYLGF